MKNLRLKVRILGSFGVVLVAMVGFGAFAFVGLGRAAERSKAVATDSVPGIIHAGNIRTLVSSQFPELRMITTSDDPVQRERVVATIKERTQQIVDELKQYEATVFQPEDRRLFDAVGAGRKGYVTSRDQVLALAQQGSLKAAADLLERETRPAFDRYQEAITALHEYNRTNAEASTKAIEETASALRIASPIVTLLAMLAAIVVALVLNGSILHPVAAILEHVGRIEQQDLASRCAYDGRDELGEVSEALNKMAQHLAASREMDRQQAEGIASERAELQAKVDALLVNVQALGTGDLTQRIEVKGDDAIGQLGLGLETLTQQLGSSMSSIAHNAQTLASAAEELSATSQQMAAGSEETSAQAATVSAAAEQVSKSVQTVAAGAEEMTVSIKEIAKNAHDATKVATAAVRVAETTNTTIAKLGESSSEIGKVIKVITSIAEQTNLLALNATIEAARAGEAGKGFAVVANEVKELAKETAKATEDISRKIDAIQGDTAAAVKAIEEIRGIIGQVNDISTTIASAVEEQTATTNEISRNVAEAARGTTDIAKNITGVATAAQTTASGSTESLAAASSLAQMAAELQGLVAQFKLAASSGALSPVRVAHAANGHGNGHSNGHGHGAKVGGGVRRPASELS